MCTRACTCTSSTQYTRTQVTYLLGAPAGNEDLGPQLRQPRGRLLLVVVLIQPCRNVYRCDAQRDRMDMWVDRTTHTQQTHDTHTLVYTRQPQYLADARVPTRHHRHLPAQVRRLVVAPAVEELLACVYVYVCVNVCMCSCLKNRFPTCMCTFERVYEHACLYCEWTHTCFIS